VRVALRHNLPVRFHAPEDEYRTTKCCCACGEVTLQATTRLRLCTSAVCRQRALDARGGGRGGAGGGGTDGGAAAAAAAVAAGEDGGGAEQAAEDNNPQGAGPSHRQDEDDGQLRHRDNNASKNIWMILVRKVAPDGGAGKRPSWLTPAEGTRESFVCRGV
jgi:hypothetical protein